MRFCGTTALARHAPLILAIGLGLCACERSPQAQTAMDPKIAKSLEDFRNRRIYRELSPSVLSGIADDNVEQAIADYAFQKLEGQSEREREVVAGFSPGVRALYVTWLVEAEVSNGGFNQYYWNSSGSYAGEAVEDFEFFGAKKHAELMRDANRIRSEEAATMKEYRRRGTLQDFSDTYTVTKLGPLDKRFYKIDENLSALRIAKIRSSPALFSGN